jgi:hypothetical protein
MNSAARHAEGAGWVRVMGRRWAKARAARAAAMARSDHSSKLAVWPAHGLQPVLGNAYQDLELVGAATRPALACVMTCPTSAWTA